MALFTDKNFSGSFWQGWQVKISHYRHYPILSNGENLIFLSMFLLWPTTVYSSGLEESTRRHNSHLFDWRLLCLSIDCFLKICDFDFRKRKPFFPRVDSST